jgi:hypothetical protein
MLFNVCPMFTVKVIIGMAHHLRRDEQAVWFHDCSHRMYPACFNRIQPWTFDRQPKGQEAHTSVTLDLLIVGADLGGDLPAYMPGGFVPEQREHFLLLPRYALAHPRQSRGGHVAHGPSINMDGIAHNQGVTA